MRRMFLLPLLTFALAAFVKGQETSSSKAHADQAIKKEIFKVEQVQDEAILKGDTAVLNRIYADNFAYSNQFGVLIPRDQVLANFRSGKAKLAAIQHDDVRMRVYGSTVVLTGISRGTYRYKSKVSKGPRTFTSVYVKMDGRWQLVAHTATDTDPDIAIDPNTEKE